MNTHTYNYIQKHTPITHIYIILSLLIYFICKQLLLSVSTCRCPLTPPTHSTCVSFVEFRFLGVLYTFTFPASFCNSFSLSFLFCFCCFVLNFLILLLCCAFFVCHMPLPSICMCGSVLFVVLVARYFLIYCCCISFIIALLCCCICIFDMIVVLHFFVAFVSVASFYFLNFIPYLNVCCGCVSVC